MAKRTTNNAGRQGKAKNGQKSTVSKTLGKCASEADDSVSVDRRTASDRRKGADRRTSNVPVAIERRKIERRAKVNRRRQIDPTTCERNYTAEELEFMGALETYKRTSGRMVPTCSEILEVLRGLGYEKRPSVPAGPDAGISTPVLPTCEVPVPPKVPAL